MFKVEYFHRLYFALHISRRMDGCNRISKAKLTLLLLVAPVPTTPVYTVQAEDVISDRIRNVAFEQLRSFIVDTRPDPATTFTTTDASDRSIDDETDETDVQPMSFWTNLTSTVETFSKKVHDTVVKFVWDHASTRVLTWLFRARFLSMRARIDVTRPIYVGVMIDDYRPCQIHNQSILDYLAYTGRDEMVCELLRQPVIVPGQTFTWEFLLCYAYEHDFYNFEQTNELVRIVKENVEGRSRNLNMTGFDIAGGYLMRFLEFAARHYHECVNVCDNNHAARISCMNEVTQILSSMPCVLARLRLRVDQCPELAQIPFLQSFQ